MRLNRRGEALAEGIQMLPRLVLVCVVAIAVLGGSTILYSYHINVRTAEAILMTRQVVDCLAPKGIVDTGLYKENKKIFSICAINGGIMNRFFVNVSIRNSLGVEIVRLEDGDSGASWVKNLFEKSSDSSLQGIKLSQPGTFSWSYDILLSDKSKGKMFVEVLVRDEK